MRARSISYLVLLFSVFLVFFPGCEKQQKPFEQEKPKAWDPAAAEPSTNRQSARRIRITFSYAAT